MAARAPAQDVEQPETKLRLTIRFLKIHWKIVFAVVWAIVLVPFCFIYSDPVRTCVMKYTHDQTGKKHSITISLSFFACYLHNVFRKFDARTQFS